MEQNSTKKKDKKSKIDKYIGTFILIIFGFLIVFSYVYQSAKQVYLNYEIVNKNKEISELKIRLTESKVENERLQTNENIEKVASEKLGMSYGETDRVIIVKETEESNTETINEDSKKIKIFVKSLYDEANSRLKQLNLESIIKYFKGN